jgi:hypothetical protein
VVEGEIARVMHTLYTSESNLREQMVDKVVHARHRRVVGRLLTYDGRSDMWRVREFDSQKRPSGVVCRKKLRFIFLAGAAQRWRRKRRTGREG